ncbi:2-dehydropantoate 2-reductase [Rubritalea tangerina]|uniref:2-dehydropantoate 2-reductase n=1 Tax=Rubritalea tangerina TaxID=430798 RepID=A0ABW4ZDI1_9BACT
MKSLGRIAIVGAGAVGSYYGARLAQAGQDVTFLLRSDYAHVREHGIEVRSVAGNFSLEQVQCVEWSEAIGEVDIVIVAWKTTANSMAEEVIRPLVGENTVILTLQNGLGNCEHLAGLFGAERVVAGLCFVCINRLGPGVISHTASGLIRIGNFSGGKDARLEEIAEVFSGAQFPCEAVESLEKALWMKLVWNFPFNGLAIAEGGVDTEVLLQERKLEPQVRAIMAEVIAVAAALGHAIPESFIDHQVAITLPMGPYRPSSMIDYVEGRAVEFEAIWQIPLQVARDAGVSVPEMEELAQRVKRRLEER